MRHYTQYGLSVIPCDSVKRPAMGSWRAQQTQIIDPGDSDYYGIVCGAVSGNLEMIDYDKKHDPTDGEMWTAYKALVNDMAPMLWDRLLIERSVNGGYHIVYRCIQALIPGSKKIAFPPGSNQAFFETKGEGGYFVCAPSPGYSLIQGEYANIPVITAREREILWSAAQSLTAPPTTTEAQAVTETASTASSEFVGGISPLDDYNQRGDALSLLRSHGWTVVRQTPGRTYLTRPGKSHGISATLFTDGKRGLYVFTTSTEFDNERFYSFAAVYATLEHAGNFSAAAKQLFRDGFGVAGTKTVTTRATGETVDSPSIIDFAWQGQYGDALLYAHIVGDTICYDASVEQWYFFDHPEQPGHWMEDRCHTVLTHAVETLISAYDKALTEARAEAEEAADDFIATVNSDRTGSERSRRKANREQTKTDLLTKRIASLRSVRYIKGVLEFAKPMLAITGTQWDSNPNVLGVRNGVVDLLTGKLRPTKTTDYIRRVVPTEFNAKARAPRFQRFIDEIFANDRATATYIQKLLGYGITGLNTEHTSPILWGADGRNGKDTLLDVLMHVLGRSVAKPVSADTIISRGRSNPGQATPELFDLWGARIVWVNETEESDRLKAAQLKALSGGSTIKCRPLHGNMVEFEPTHLLLLVTNFKPSAPAHDTALWERLNLIPFTERFVEDPKRPNEHQADKNLKENLRKEASGILNWLVEGTLLWRKEGLKRPESIKKASSEYRSEQDSVGSWLDEACEIDVSYAVKASEAYQSYENWCKINGAYPLGRKNFTLALEQRGFDAFQHKYQIRGRGFNGFRPSLQLKYASFEN